MREMQRAGARTTRVIAAALFGAALAAAAGSHAAEPGERAPECALVALGAPERPLALSDFAGRVVWLSFWASWCSECAESFPVFDAIQRELGDRGLAVIGVNVDVERARAEKFLAAHSVTFVQAVEAQIGDCARAFDVAGMPTSFVVDADGVVRRVHRGFRRGEIEATRRMLADLLPTPEPGDPTRR
jgi:thiol-disulfide isomerase/thioredoxin